MAGISMQKGLKRKWGVDIMKIEIFTLPYFFQQKKGKLVWVKIKRAKNSVREFHREKTDAILQDLQAKQENVKRFMILN